METIPLLDSAGKNSHNKKYPGNNYREGYNMYEVKGQQSDWFYEGCISGLGSLFGLLGSYVCCCFNPYVVVNQGEVLVVTRFGRYCDTKEPGLHYLRPLTDKGYVVSKMTHVIDLPQQSVLTQDNLTVHIDGAIYYRVIDAEDVTFRINNLQSCLNQMSVSALRSCFSNHTLQDCLENRDKLAEEIRSYTAEHTGGWGVEVTNTIIKDIMLSNDLQRNLSSKATAERTAAAKIIEAQADVNAAKLMRDAAEALNTPAALQIRYLETMKAISAHPNNKVIFIPMNHGDSLTNIAAAMEGIK